MKNSWRVILTFSQNSLGKQFRNDLMMLRGYCTPGRKNKTKQKQKQTHTHTPTHTHPPHTHTHKHVLCSIPKLISTPF